MTRPRPHGARPPRAVSLSEDARERIRQSLLSLALCHELKQPLHSLVLNVELLGRRLARERGAASEQGREAQQPLASLGRAVQRINECVDVFAARVVPEPVGATPVDLHPVLEAALRQTEPAAARAGVRLVLAVSEPLPLLPVHAGQLEVGLVCLLENAALASPPGREVILRARREGDDVHVEVADQGVGMAPEVLRRAAEIGFSTRPEAQGVGLTIAKFVAYHHTGGFLMRSEAGRGTTMTMTLPIEPAR